jgi:hypothetical protein
MERVTRIGQIDGVDVAAVMLGPFPGPRVRILTYGARLAEMWVADKDGPLTDIALADDTAYEFADQDIPPPIRVGRLDGQHEMSFEFFAQESKWLAPASREGSTAVAFPPPHSNREPKTRPLTGPFFFLFQRSLAEPSDFWRLGDGPKSVSERPASLSTRPSPKLRRIQKVTFFQPLGRSGLRRG